MVSFANFTRYATIGGIFKVQDADASLSMGTALITYDSSETYRDENIEFYHYDATTFELIANVEIDLKEGADPLIANSTATLLRNETSNSNGVFKFIAVPAGFYSVYGRYNTINGDKSYFEDYDNIVVLGMYTAGMPNIYLLPTYDSYQGEMWVRIKYNSSMTTSLGVSINLNL